MTGKGVGTGVCLAVLVLSLIGCSSWSTCGQDALLAELAHDDPEAREVTIIIALSSILPGGVVGHTGIAVDDQYWDYGPSRVDRMQQLAAVASQAGPWWDDPEQDWQTDHTLAEVLEVMPGEVKPPGSLVAVFRVQVTDEQADALVAFWDDVYERMRRGEEQYRLRGRQCANMVAWSLDAAMSGEGRPSDRMPQRLWMLTPTTFYEGLSRSLVHTDGPRAGEPADLVLLQLGADGFERYEPAFDCRQIDGPQMPRTRLALERMRFMPVSFFH